MTTPRLTDLLPLARDMTASLSAEDRTRRLVDVVRRALPCDAVALLRLDGDALVPVAVHGLTDDVWGRRFARAEHPRLEVICQRRAPTLFPADSPLPDPYDGLVAGGPESLGGHVHSCLGCPLTVEGELVGVLTADALEPGAFDAIDPLFLEHLAALAGAALRTNALIEALQRRAEVQGLVARDLVRDVMERRGTALLGTSAAMARLREEVDLVAPTPLPVLVVGETGVGKELVVRSLHAQSPRAEQPLVYVNCAALPEAIVESELFGHVKGAFTGAEAERLGKFRAADGASLFLDEIGELPLHMQPKLLRALQEGEVQCVGSDRLVQVDVRIFAATNRDLAAEVAAGRFRADLLHRLDVCRIAIPPLREHPEDVALLAGHFADRARGRLGSGPVRFTPEAREALAAGLWPGNVRELENVISRGILRAAARVPARQPVLVRAEDLDRIASSAPVAAAAALDREAAARGARRLPAHPGRRRGRAPRGQLGRRRARARPRPRQPPPPGEAARAQVAGRRGRPPHRGGALRRTARGSPSVGARESPPRPLIPSPMTASPTAALLFLSLGLGRVWIVDAAGGAGADFATIQEAVDAAGEGDTVLVRDGVYAAFTLAARSLTVVAEGDGARVTGTRSIVVRDLGPAQAALVRGLATDFGLRVEDCDGAVWIEELEASAQSVSCRGRAVPGLAVTGSRRVTLARSTLSGGVDLGALGYGPSTEPGVDLDAADVRLLGCRVDGGLGPPGVPGAAGIRLRDAGATLVGCTVTGGGGGLGSPPLGGSLCDAPHAVGGPGIELVGLGSTVRVAASSVAGGERDLSVLCPGVSAPAGPAYAGTGTVVGLPGAARGLAAAAPVRSGELLTLVAEGPPGEVPVLFLSRAHDPAPAWNGAWLLGAPVEEVLVLQPLSAAGRSSLALRVPGLGSVESLVYHVQALHVDAALTVWAGSGTSAVLVGP